MRINFHIAKFIILTRLQQMYTLQITSRVRLEMSYKPISFTETEEELRSIGVLSRVSHREGT